MAFTFVHAADLHLDSPFEGLGVDSTDSPHVAKAAREATFVALDRIVALCLEREADFLLIAGDVYDRGYRTTRAQLRFRDAVQTLSDAGVQTFVVHGNHDPLSATFEAIDWPEALTVFGSEAVETVSLSARDGTPVTISGISYRDSHEERRLHRKFSRPDTAGYHIAVLHCSLSTHRGRRAYCECELGELTERGFDYWALGHVHTRRILSEQPYVVYPGNPQSRSVRETGPRGCTVATVTPEHKKTACEFVPTDSVRWERLEVALDTISTLDQAETVAETVVSSALQAAQGRDLVLRLHLTGRTPLHRDLAVSATRDTLLERLRATFSAERPFAWVEQLDVACAPEIDLAKRAEERDLLGEVLRTTQALEQNPERAAILRDACTELLDHNKMSRNVDEPAASEWDDLLADARNLCLDLLQPTHAREQD